MKPVKATEKAYERALRKIARHAADIVDMFSDGAEIANPAAMMKALNDYARMIEPWAAKTAGKMIASTQASVERTIKAQSREIAKELAAWLRTDSGQVAKALQMAQVDLIKSIPLESGLRAQNLAMQAVTGGRRPAEVAAEIARTNEVTQSRAMLIARTESAKASAVITESRAKAVGATHYIWRTAQDSDVRESHAEMEGEVVSYDNPPILDGMQGHAGEFPNCRCYQEPVIPD